MSIFPIVLFIVAVAVLLFLTLRKRYLNNIIKYQGIEGRLNSLKNVKDGREFDSRAVEEIIKEAGLSPAEVEKYFSQRRSTTAESSSSRSHYKAARRPSRPSSSPERRDPAPARTAAQQKAFIRTIMQPVVSLILLIAALFIVFSDKFSPSDKHWAFTTIGAVLGFWLKG